VQLFCETNRAVNTFLKKSFSLAIINYNNTSDLILIQCCLKNDMKLFQMNRKIYGKSFFNSQKIKCVAVALESQLVEHHPEWSRDLM